jgi:hypothetical protein
MLVQYMHGSSQLLTVSPLPAVRQDPGGPASPRNQNLVDQNQVDPELKRGWCNTPRTLCSARSSTDTRQFKVAACSVTNSLSKTVSVTSVIDPDARVTLG